MASFTGELQDFYDIVLPKIRNNIASMTKKKKIELRNNTFVMSFALPKYLIAT